MSKYTHGKRSERHKLEKESLYEHTPHIRNVATMGTADGLSSVQHIINRLRIISEYKYLMYGAKTFKELREKYGIYDEMYDIMSEWNMEKK